MVKFTDTSIDMVEEVYQYFHKEDANLTDEPAYPLRYKLDLLYILSCLFNDNGCYSRSREILDIMKKIYDSNPDNVHAAFKYTIASISQAYDIWSIDADTPEEFLKPFDEIEKKFTESNQMTRKAHFYSHSHFVSVV